MKRVISLILSMAMSLSLLQTTALAQEITLAPIEPQAEAVTAEVSESTQDSSGETETTAEVDEQTTPVEPSEQQTAEEAVGDAVAEEVEADEAVAEEEASAVLEEQANTFTGYVMMNLPYDVFYKADINNKVAVDAFTSATKSKPANAGLAGSTYHKADNSEITGVTYPVFVNALDLSSYTEVDKDSIASAPSYAYYKLDTTPDSFKTLNADGSVSAISAKPTVADNATATITTDSRYGDYQISVSGLFTETDREGNVTKQGALSKDAVVYGATLTDNNGNSYGLRALENIWRKTELAFCTGHTAVVHNCPTSDAHYKALEGRTITAITYYTNEGNYTVNCSLKCLPYSEATLTASISEDGTKLSVTVPNSFENPRVTVSAGATLLLDKASVAGGSQTLTLTTKAVGGTTYTVSVESDNYAQLSTTTNYVGSPKYVLMNVPFADFYKAENISDGQQEVDAVSTATTSKFKGTTGLAKGTYNNGTAMVGVTMPVEMTEATYNTLSASKLDAEGDLGTAASYSFKDYDGTPAAYKVLTYTAGFRGAPATYSFSDFKGAQKSTNGLSVTEYTTSGGYGDYQITLDGVKTAGTINDEAYTIYGAVMTTSDGMNYATYALNNLWYGTRIPNVELAWSVKDGQELKRGHGSGEKFFEYDMNGKTLTNVKLLTSLGTYDIVCEQKLDLYSSEKPTVALNKDDATKLDMNVPASYQNPTVTVAYGRTTVAENIPIVNGQAVLPVAVDIYHNGTYTVTVKSDNFAPAPLSLMGCMTKAQENSLKELLVQGKTLFKTNSELTLLAEHITEAEALLANADATSTQASKLVSELTTLVNQAKQSTPLTESAFSAIAGTTGTRTYQGLFAPTIFKDEYNDIWLTACEKLVGKADAQAAAEMLKNAMRGEGIGASVTEEQKQNSQFNCEFRPDANAKLTFSTTDGKYTLSNGTSTYTYTYYGEDTIGYSHEVSLYKSSDRNAGEYTYLMLLDDCPETTYHIEFRYGSSLVDLEQALNGSYAYWLAAGIPADADSAMITNVINLFCEENGEDVKAKFAANLKVSTTSYSKKLTDKVFNLNATADRAISYQTSNAKVATVDEQGTVTIKGVGTATITVTSGNESVTVTVKVAKVAQPMTVKADKSSVSYNASKAQTVKLTVSKAQGAVSYKTSNKNITVKNGVVTIAKGTKVGTYTVTVTAKGNTNYNSGAKTVTIKVTKAAQPMTVKVAKTSVSYNKNKAQTVKLTVSKAQGAVSYKTSNKSVTVKNGVVTLAKGLKKGTYTITVTAKGNSTYSSGSKQITIKVK